MRRLSWLLGRAIVSGRRTRGLRFLLSAGPFGTKQEEDCRGDEEDIKEKRSGGIQGRRKEDRYDVQQEVCDQRRGAVWSEERKAGLQGGPEKDGDLSRILVSSSVNEKKMVNTHRSDKGDDINLHDISSGQIGDKSLLAGFVVLIHIELRAVLDSGE